MRWLSEWGALLGSQGIANSLLPPGRHSHPTPPSANPVGLWPPDPDRARREAPRGRAWVAPPPASGQRAKSSRPLWSGYDEKAPQSEKCFWSAGVVEGGKRGKGEESPRRGTGRDELTVKRGRRARSQRSGCCRCRHWGVCWAGRRLGGTPRGGCLPSSHRDLRPLPEPR